MKAKKFVHALSGIALAVAAFGSSASVVQLDTSAAGLGGTNTFNFSEITLTTQGVSTITVTDTDGNGTLDASFGDTFLETGLVAVVNFVNPNGVGNVPVGTSGIGLNYEMYAVFTPPNGGPLVGSAGVVAGTTAVGIFTPPTNVTVYYDSNATNGVFDLGTSTAVGQMTLAGSPLSNCEMPSFGAAQGSCVLTFDFDQAGVTAAGVWTIGGVDLGLLNAVSRVDMNVDALSSPFTAVYPGGAGSAQVRTTRQDGSAVFIVPEPGVLGLLGLGLLVAGGLSRRRSWS